MTSTSRSIASAAPGNERACSFSKSSAPFGSVETSARACASSCTSADSGSAGAADEEAGGLASSTPSPDKPVPVAPVPPPAGARRAPAKNARATELASGRAPGTTGGKVRARSSNGAGATASCGGSSNTPALAAAALLGAAVPDSTSARSALRRSRRRNVRELLDEGRRNRGSDASALANPAPNAAATVFREKPDAEHDDGRGRQLADAALSAHPSRRRQRRSTASGAQQLARDLVDVGGVLPAPGLAHHECFPFVLSR